MKTFRKPQQTMNCMSTRNSITLKNEDPEPLLNLNP